MKLARKSRLLGVVVVALALTLALVLAGCGGSTEETTTTAAPTTTAGADTTMTSAPVSTSVPATDSTSTTTGEPGTTTTEILSSAETRLADGTIKGMGFIDAVWEEGGVRYLSIDYAEMLTGEEARQAAIEAGVIGPDEDLPNDYYIRNLNPKTREFTIAASVAITTATRSEGFDQPATWEEFLSFWSASPPEDATHLNMVPWWIVRNGHEVFSIDEQYIP